MADYKKFAYKDFTCCNDYASLSHHRDSLKGAVIDFKICFKHRQYTVRDVIHIASHLVKELIDAFHREDLTVRGNLVARVMYVRTSTEEEVVYHHSSCPSEIIDDAEDFFVTHMMAIAERLDSWNRNGSNLLIKDIELIYVQLNIQN